MSQFIDKLKQVSQATPQPMGFRATQPSSDKPGILLIASLAQTDVDSLADRVAGADAGLLRIAELNSGAKAFGEVSQAVPDIPWGGWLEGIAEEEVEQMAKIGFDFVVFPPASTSLAILKDKKVGKILQVEVSINEGLLPAVDELPADAVLVVGGKEEDYSLTWQHLLFFQRCADLLTKPLLVSIPSNVSTNELQTLCEAGVNGVVVKTESEQPTGRLKELRQAIDKLAFTAPRKPRKTEPLLPYPSGKTYTVVEEEEE
jgi:hypothetical protein